MKKILLSLCSLMFTAMLFSQDQKLEIGIQLAPSITSLWGNSMINQQNSRLVISPRITLDYYLNQNFALNSGLAFERKGTKSKTTAVDSMGWPIGDVAFKINYDYLTLPLMATYTFDGKVKFYLGGGTFLSYLISAKSIINEIEDYPEQTENHIETTKKIDLGLSFIGGLKIPVADKLLIDIGLREYFG